MDVGSWIVMPLLLIGTLAVCRLLVIWFQSGDAKWRPSDKVIGDDITRTALDK